MSGRALSFGLSYKPRLVIRIRLNGRSFFNPGRERIVITQAQPGPGRRQARQQTRQTEQLIVTLPILTRAGKLGTTEKHTMVSDVLRGANTLPLNPSTPFACLSIITPPSVICTLCKCRCNAHARTLSQSPLLPSFSLTRPLRPQFPIVAPLIQTGQEE